MTIDELTIEPARVVNLNPESIVVLEVPPDLTPEQAARASQQLERIFPHNEVLVVAGRLSVVEP